MIYRIKNTKNYYKININPVNLVNPVKKIILINKKMYLKLNDFVKESFFRVIRVFRGQNN